MIEYNKSGYSENDEFNGETLTESEKEAKKRRKEEEKRRKRYKFSDKKHSKLGIASCIAALCALGLLAAAIVISISTEGNAQMYVGWMIGGTMLLATAGIVMSAVTFRNVDILLTFSWIGLFSSIILWLLAGTVVAIGI